MTRTYSNSKLKVDDLQQKYVYWIAAGSSLLLLAVGILGTMFSPDILFESKELEKCPNNRNEARIATFCQLFNLKENTYWYSYTHKFTPTEYFLWLKTTPILKAKANSTSNFKLQYSITFYTVDHGYNQRDKYSESDYNEVETQCKEGREICSTAQLYMSASLTTDQYMVRIDLLNIEDVRLNFLDLKMVMVEMNPSANMYLAMISCLVLVFSILRLCFYRGNKKKYVKTNLPLAEKYLYAIGLSVIALDLPISTASALLTSFGTRVVFIISLVTFACLLLLYWIKLLEAPTTLEQQFARILWWEYLGAFVLWMSMLVSSIYFMYLFDNNPALQLSEA